MAQQKVRFYWEDDSLGCLANCSPHTINMHGCSWPTAEHLFQAERFPFDCELRRQIRHAATAREAKRIAHQNIGETRKDWQLVRGEVMRQVVLAKFTQNEEAARGLLSTHDLEIVENSPDETFWGCGPKGDGQNVLGKILMEVRETLRS
jgi:ribA/ribD-fused uncharacterized protein